MISGSDVGHIAVWNLETRSLVVQQENIHSGAVSGMKCLPSEPLLVTSSPDNSLRLWIMDSDTLGPRLYRFKEGHFHPPDRVRFYGESGFTILSAGRDSCIRSFSLEAEFLNFSLGKAAFNLKQAKKGRAEKQIMPAITEFYAEPTREGEWDNIVARHEGLPAVSTWSYHRRTRGSFLLLHERFKKLPKVMPTVSYALRVAIFEVSTFPCLQCTVITACGNFCVIGYSTGHVDRFNIQSGIHRLSYGAPVGKPNRRAVCVCGSCHGQLR